MTKAEEQQKTCKSCKHYVAHYVIDNLRFMEIEGHCGNYTLTKLRKQNKFRLQENCEYWEENTLNKTKRRESIKATLRSMKRSLDQIKSILENDNEDLSK